MGQLEPIANGSFREFPGPQRVVAELGAIHRRAFRRELVRTGWQWREDKALASSLFAVEVPAGHVLKIASAP